MILHGNMPTVPLIIENLLKKNHRKVWMITLYYWILYGYDEKG